MTVEEAARFVEEKMKTIFAWSLSRVSHRQDAEDLAGDIIVAILKSAPRVRDDDAFFGYVWTVAQNTYKSFLRRKKRGVSVDIDGIAESASESDVEGVITLPCLTEIVSILCYDAVEAERSRYRRRMTATRSRSMR